MTQPSVHGLTHHWAQGPLDVRPLGPGRWEFPYWIEWGPDMAWLEPWAWESKCDLVLNRDPRSWGARLNLNFRRVSLITECDIVLRFNNGPPLQWPGLEGLGWYYHDPVVGKNVAHVSALPELFNNTPGFTFVLGMEAVGHGTLRMWDMYIQEHEPYIGSMGSWASAMLNDGWPIDADIADGLVWLDGQTPPELIHNHPQFTVPSVVI